MLPRSKSRFWHASRRGFRWVRITGWLLILLVLGALLYLNKIGLPDFAKQQLLAKLQARGLDLQFTRIRLRWYQGIVADNVRFGQANEPVGPQLTVSEVQVHLSGSALRKLQLQVDGVTLRQGRLVIPVADAAPLLVENIYSDLSFLPNDQWALDHFKANFAGAKIQLSGIVTNASAVREWTLWQPGPSTPAGAWQNRLRQLSDALHAIHFSSPPELTLDLHGDARELDSFYLHILLVAPGAETPWGAVSQGRLAARLSPATNGISHAELTLEAGDASTRWALITNFHMVLRLASSDSASDVINSDLNVFARQVSTRWGEARNAQLTSQWLHSITNPVPLSGQVQFRSDQAQTQWGSARRVGLEGSFAAPPAATLPPCDASWRWWTNLHPYLVNWSSRLIGVQSSKFAADEITAGGGWRAPQLTITNLHARLYGGQLEGRASLDAATRALDLKLASDCDLRQLAPWLPESNRLWLAQIEWRTPPRINCNVSLLLPAWTNRQPDWRGEIQPTLQVAGGFTLDQGITWRQMSLASVHSHFLYSNLCWSLPDLAATRPEGRLSAECRADERTGEFYGRAISSTFDPNFLRPILGAGVQQGLDLLALTQPPVIEAEARGSYHEPERTVVQGRVALTNFSFRGESVDALQAAMRYTNGLLECFDLRLQRGDQRISADGLAADLHAQLVWLTNGFSTADPMFVARVIGPQIVSAIEPYQYLKPPTARVHGVIPLHGESGADLHFDLDGGPFHWWKFNLPRVAGHVHWQGQDLTLTNVQADFYRGQAAGWAAFDFRPRKGDDFQFSLTATNALLQALVADLFTASNHLEGTLNGTLVVTKANTKDWRTVFGYGDVNLRDGLIWDIPLFGIFSPVLNEITPGLGSSRASSAVSTFAITNGAIRSTDLEIRSSVMRLQYRGVVDLEGRVNARVVAEPLRDMWVVGPLFTTVLWPVTKLFEYKVTGTVENPKTEPLYLLPKVMLFPFHPLRTLKDLVVPDGSTSSRTNAPPAAAP